MLEEAEALRVVAAAVELVGGARFIVANPRHPYALRATQSEVVDGHEVEINFSEMSAPAIATVEGWVIEVREHEYVVLSRPRIKKA